MKVKLLVKKIYIYVYIYQKNLLTYYQQLLQFDLLYGHNVPAMRRQR